MITVLALAWATPGLSVVGIQFLVPGMTGAETTRCVTGATVHGCLTRTCIHLTRFLLHRPSVRILFFPPCAELLVYPTYAVCFPSRRFFLGGARWSTLRNRSAFQSFHIALYRCLSTAADGYFNRDPSHHPSTRLERERRRLQ